jgi:hypothetical protein
VLEGSYLFFILFWERLWCASFHIRHKRALQFDH